MLSLPETCDHKGNVQAALLHAAAATAALGGQEGQSRIWSEICDNFTP